MKLLSATSFALLLAAGFHTEAQAQLCTATATTAVFGVYNPLSATSNTTNATVTVTCSSAVSLLVAYTVTLSPGNGSYAQRKMFSGGNSLAYQIYTNASHTQVWGDGTAGTGTQTGGYLLAVGVPVTNNYTAYGQIPALQNAAVGSYTDTILVTVSY